MPTTEAPRSAALALGEDEPRALAEAAAPLALLERAHLSLRLLSAPWARVIAALEPAGRLLDVGCGPGLLAHLLARAGFAGEYVGLDPDPRKVERARRWLAESPSRRFAAGSVEDAPKGSFSQVAVVDVLYLVPPDQRDLFLSRAVRALAPGGMLVALTSGGGPRWKRRLDALQERLAVGLGITQGGAVVPCDGVEIAERLLRAGLGWPSVADAGKGYAHGFELVTARRPPA